MTQTVAPVLAPGVVVADTYEVDRLIGRGGMGEVWLARHRRLAGKQVAIKVLHIAGSLTTEALKRFQREAEIAARLEHPNLVQVLDFNTLPTGQPFLVMEFLKGESLSARMKRGRLDLELVQQLVRQVGAALQAAHSAGVVHRDLKPENIFLVPTALGDTVKVLDFGISKLANSSTVQTTDAVLIGTPLYMSPEQALGNNRDVTAQSDLFSLGSICYELLAGDAPFASASIATVIFRIAYEKHVPLLQARPDLPLEVAAAVEHALVKDCAGRTASIEAFVAEFTGKPINPRPGSGVVAVYEPGMQVSESLLSAKTAAPATPHPLPPQPQPQATPAQVSPTAPTRPDAAALGVKTVSGTKLALGLIAVVGVLFATVKLLRPLADAEKAAISALADAGLLESPVDAGTSLAAVGLDAGMDLPDASVPALVKPVLAVPDAGRVAARLPPGTEDDLRVLAQMQSLLAARQYEDVVNKRALVYGMSQSRAKADALKLLVQAMCERRDTQLKSAIDYLRRLAPHELAEPKRRCVAVWADAADRDW